MLGPLRRGALAVVPLTLVLATGCSNGSDRADRTPTASPSPTPSPTPGQELAARAGQGVKSEYTARYALDAADPKTPKTELVVYRTPKAMRVDVISKGATATLVSNAKGIYSCRLAGKAKTCFLIAKPNQPIPPLFDAGVQQVFTSYLSRLAAQAGQYDVELNGTTPATGRIPEGTCFDVKATPGAPKPVVAPGRYCLSETGIVTSVTYQSGTLTLVGLSGPPAPRWLQPYASPTPLPS